MPFRGEPFGLALYRLVTFVGIVFEATPIRYRHPAPFVIDKPRIFEDARDNRNTLTLNAEHCRQKNRALNQNASAVALS
jgi:hypothetical protein